LSFGEAAIAMVVIGPVYGIVLSLPLRFFCPQCTPHIVRSPGTATLYGLSPQLQLKSEKLLFIVLGCYPEKKSRTHMAEELAPGCTSCCGPMRISIMRYAATPCPSRWTTPLILPCSSAEKSAGHRPSHGSPHDTPRHQIRRPRVGDSFPKRPAWRLLSQDLYRRPNGRLFFPFSVLLCTGRTEGLITLQPGSTAQTRASR
jgi:hypothetical protein